MFVVLKVIIKTLLAAAILFIIAAKPAAAQTEFGFAVWDVDRLYDTIPSPRYNDSDYTPDGRLKWNSERYRHRVELTAAVIDSMAVPVVALCGIENENVVRDIALCCQGEYAYIHRTLDTRDGMDVALLYYADLLFVSHTDGGRHHLTVEGRIGDADYAFIICASAEELPVSVGRLRRDNSGIRIVAAGNLRYANLHDTRLHDFCTDSEAEGQGNALFRNGWKMTERIAVSAGLEAECSVYARRWMLGPKGSPHPLYHGRVYKGGTGRRLPTTSRIRVSGSAQK